MPMDSVLLGWHRVSIMPIATHGATVPPCTIPATLGKHTSGSLMPTPFLLLGTRRAEESGGSKVAMMARRQLVEFFMVMMRREECLRKNRSYERL